MGTHFELVDRAGSQCVWRDKHRKLLASATVAKRVCEDGGAWWMELSVMSVVCNMALLVIPGRYASLITSYGRSQYRLVLLAHCVHTTHRAVHVLIDRHGVPQSDLNPLEKL